MSLSDSEIFQLRAALQDAVVKCSERCLYQSAKWAAELLNSIHEPEIQASSQDTITAGPPPAAFSPSNPDPEEARLEAQEFTKYLLAKSLFDCREYDRCAAVFLPESMLSGVVESRTAEPLTGTPKGKGKSRASTGAAEPASGGATAAPATALPKISQKSLFLALYAKVISGEKRKDEDAEMVMGPHDAGSVGNKQLVLVSRYLNAWFDERYGMVLAKEKNNDRAIEYLVRSVHLFPMNWGCWLEMASLISRVEDLNRIAKHLPHNIVSFMFHLHTSLELFQQGPSLANSLDQLLDIFPTSSFLLTCNALLSYHAKDFVAAEQHFSRLLAHHPYRLDSLDHYSNILYVMNMRPKLAFLAHLCSNVDKFRPESCVVVGNYYSLLSMHEKAVQYFRRALTLDRTCLSAWTLMGHEYVELKNTHAAIESYRRAVDVNRRDYRAWYGLGQTYEMLEMHTYALWYYKKAAGLRPWDGKMWLAVGSCLEKMDRDRDGIKALKRALLADAYYDAGSSSFGGAAATIANMYNRLGELDEAKSYMELCLAQEDGVAGGGADAEGGRFNESINIHNDSPPRPTTARMWLARYALETEDYTAASRLATELCEDGVEVEEAKALLREARARMDVDDA
ncbi:unnamed protein product [Parascedosporium putredinis]|uniref:Cdc23 domain-containing protein n=1 Tax=Parascedosporium putredinis TaxID=1442378 RepID=A0A9P1H0U6_9PEZI|nr:unnamed protein product [Parascedosporium putredinis]CAI7993033.1 unnamed protein product [Parascedosporium putredinis]